MFERILLPLDGTEQSEMVLPYGEELASKLGSEIILYHVHGREQQHQEHMHHVYLNGLAETVRNNIKKGQVKSAEVKVTTIVEAGEPRGNICNLINQNKVDLIIMTAVSASGLKVGKMLGSVTDDVCRTVSIPVMLVRLQGVRRAAGRERLINRILITLDGSELSKLALPVGEELAARLKVSATLFQMVTMFRIYDYGMGSSTYFDYAKLDEEKKNLVSAEMIALEKELKDRGLNVSNIVTSGLDAANEIIEACKKTGTDLVVMSTHGRSGLGRWVFGSVAEKVLRHGETPLLLVRARAG